MENKADPQNKADPRVYCSTFPGSYGHEQLPGNAQLRGSYSNEQHVPVSELVFVFPSLLIFVYPLQALSLTSRHSSLFCAKYMCPALVEVCSSVRCTMCPH